MAYTGAGGERMVQKGVPYIPVNKRANNPVDSFTPALDFFFFFSFSSRENVGARNSSRKPAAFSSVNCFSFPEEEDVWTCSLLCFVTSRSVGGIGGGLLFIQSDVYFALVECWRKTRAIRHWRNKQGLGSSFSSLFLSLRRHRFCCFYLFIYLFFV